MLRIELEREADARANSEKLVAIWLPGVFAASAIRP